MPTDSSSPLLALALVGLPGCVLITDDEWALRTSGGSTPDEACEAEIFYTDADGDGFGDPRGNVQACEQPEGTVDNWDDCDDSDPDITDLLVWYRDDDGDGWGGEQTTSQCTQPPLYVARSGDCDDTDADVSPDAAEVCNGVDDDCDGDADSGASDAAVWYLDNDGDGFGNPDVTLSACEAPLGYVANDDDCFDSDAASNPAAVEVCNDGVDNDCDGTVNDCELTGTYAATDADAFVAGAIGSQAGQSLALGDVTGDGVADLILGAPEGSAAVSRAGDVTITAGPITAGVDAASGLTLTGDETFARTGWTTQAPGDLDGDGFEELLVGAYFDDGPAVNSGVAWLLHGPITGGPIADVAIAIQGVNTSDRAGIAMASAGDHTRDGVPELAVGAMGANGGDGGVFVFIGPVTADTDLTSGVALTGAGGEKAGYAVHGPGDLTGDGQADLVVAGWQTQFGDSGVVGAAYVIAGPVTGPGALTDLAETVLYGDTTFMGAGGTLASADLSGDGSLDLVVGVVPLDGYADAGRAWVITTLPTGPVQLGSVASATLQGDADEDNFGSALSAGGDLNGDGASDLLVGAPGNIPVPAVSGEFGAGAAYAFYGPITGSLSPADADVTVTGSAESALGTSVALGDISGDGLLDLVLGAPQGTAEGATLLFGRGL